MKVVSRRTKIRIFKCSFAKFSRGSMPPDPPRRSRAVATSINAICDVTTFSAVSSTPHQTLLEQPLQLLPHSFFKSFDRSVVLEKKPSGKQLQTQKESFNAQGILSMTTQFKFTTTIIFFTVKCSGRVQL